MNFKLIDLSLIIAFVLLITLGLVSTKSNAYDIYHKSSSYGTPAQSSDAHLICTFKGVDVEFNHVRIVSVDDIIIEGWMDSKTNGTLFIILPYENCKFIT